MAESNEQNSEVTGNNNPETTTTELSTDVSKIDDSPEQARETTRSKIARFYVYAFFGTILLAFVIGLINCFEVKDYKEMLVTVSGVLSGPLGFIIGYYFKSASSKD